ncbi:carbohydrate ABC transporter substrate-binding protein [Actinomyces sp. 186855]|nr:carbohydrate ABC transporter substrate-binding protein [Actinomyces sp. AC-20-1]MCL3789650.1 carbohydrate ABC transporter substrate-binding protein [Actinomyces sp. 187325]MCL3792185.1 carbohydrate ABC transporter substrate-binding protein [Actinomyces sp. 186855]MCL3794817.1 carbohydrate ABC transporter substrate-binding protein [Actinomyces sp. 217892]
MTTVSRRHALGLGAALVGVLTISACGRQGGGSSSDANSLTIWLGDLNSFQKADVERFIAAFEAAHEGYTCAFQTHSTDDLKEAMRQVSGTTAGPDIYWYWEGPGLGGEMVQAKMSEDLTRFYEQYGWEDRFTSASLAGITQYGGYHGIPWTLQAEALYYNKDLFEQAGITSEPTTYAELTAACDALVAAGITPIQFGGTVNWHVMRLLDTLIEMYCGADVATTLVTDKKGWDTEAGVTQAFTELKRWADTYFNKGYMSISNDDSNLLFYNGTAAMALEGTWFNANAVDNGMDPTRIGIFPFPTGTGRLYGFGEGFYINPSSTKIDTAAMFLDFITSTEQMSEGAGTWAAISVNKDVPVGEENPLDALWVPILESSDEMYNNFDQALSLNETTEYWRIQNAVLIGQMTPEEAGPAMQRFIDANA